VRSLATIPFLLLFAAPAGAHEGLPTTLERLDDRVAAAPDDLDLRLLRAESRRLNRDPAGALDDVRAAARLAPDDPRVDVERGLAQLALGDRDAALGSLRRYLEAVDRPRVDALVAHADLAPAGALADLDRAVAIEPSPDLCLRRGALLEARADLAAAAAGYRACAARLDGAVVLRLAAVRVDRARGAADAALAEVDSLLALRADHPGWLELRADVLDDLGRADEARAERYAALAAVEARLTRRRSPRLEAQRAALLEDLGGTP